MMDLSITIIQLKMEGRYVSITKPILHHWRLVPRRLLTTLLTSSSPQNKHSVGNDGDSCPPLSLYNLYASDTLKFINCCRL